MQIFIISWTGQHQNAIKIASQLIPVFKDVYIVYSDKDPKLKLNAPCKLIMRPNHLFWADKFKACIDQYSGDDILVIHADCTFDDWSSLAIKCIKTIKELPNIGVWAPKIDWVSWTMKMVKIATLNNPDLNVVARTDGIVFFLNKKIVQRMRLVNYENNLYGRGIELLFVTACYSMGMLAVIDSSVLVKHPKSTGYPVKDAHEQFINFFDQFTACEHAHRLLFKSHLMLNGGKPIIPE
jgi:hypothetical protein